MERLWSVGTAVILWLQSLGSGVRGPMELLSFLGEVEFYLVMIPALYWCWDAKRGLRLGLLLMLSGGINEALKAALRQPRPFWVSPAVEALVVEHNFGLPSGHAQHAVCVWGWLAHQTRRAWVWASAVLLILLICVSRAYLGVHFPHSLLLGAMVGAMLLWAFVRWEPRASAWLADRSLGQQLCLALLGSMALLGLSGMALAGLRGWSVPTAWMQAAIDKTGEPIDISSPVYAVMCAGVLFGMGAGAAWLQHLGGFSGKGPMLQRLKRYVLGMIVVATLWFGLESLLPQNAGTLAMGLRFLHASLVGFWVAGGAPLVFRQLGLAGRGPDEGTPSSSV